MGVSTTLIWGRFFFWGEELGVFLGGGIPPSLHGVGLDPHPTLLFGWVKPNPTRPPPPKMWRKVGGGGWMRPPGSLRLRGVGGMDPNPTLISRGDIGKWGGDWILRCSTWRGWLWRWLWRGWTRTPFPMEGLDHPPVFSMEGLVPPPLSRGGYKGAGSHPAPHRGAGSTSVLHRGSMSGGWIPPPPRSPWRGWIPPPRSPWRGWIPR